MATKKARDATPAWLTYGFESPESDEYNDNDSVDEVVGKGDDEETTTQPAIIFESKDFICSATQLKEAKDRLPSQNEFESSVETSKKKYTKKLTLQRTQQQWSEILDLVKQGKKSKAEELRDYYYNSNENLPSFKQICRHTKDENGDIVGPDGLKRMVFEQTMDNAAESLAACGNRRERLGLPPITKVNGTIMSKEIIPCLHCKWSFPVAMLADHADPSKKQRRARVQCSKAVEENKENSCYEANQKSNNGKGRGRPRKKEGQKQPIERLSHGPPSHQSEKENDNRGPSATKEELQISKRTTQESSSGIKQDATAEEELSRNADVKLYTKLSLEFERAKRIEGINPIVLRNLAREIRTLENRLGFIESAVTEYLDHTADDKEKKKQQKSPPGTPSPAPAPAPASVLSPL